ncbi:MAG: sugar phosphate isomerase/epimerase family protein [Gemmataceae bacterium]
MSTITRRHFLQATGVAAAVGLGVVPGQTAAAPAADAPPFQLGLVTYNSAALWDLPTLLKVCQNVGLAAVELRTTHKHGVEPSLNADQRRAARQRFRDSGVTFWGCGSVCEFHSPDPAVVRQNIETCKRFVQLVADVGGIGVKVRPNGLPKEVPVEKTLEQIGKALRECGQAGADANVEICLEVHGPGTAHPPHVKTIMEHCGHSKVGVTWNSNKDDIKDGSVAEYFHLLRPWMLSCHINNLYGDATGGYPYRELFRLMRETKYNRYTMYEGGRASTDVPLGEELLRYYKGLWLELARG